MILSLGIEHLIKTETSDYDNEEEILKRLKRCLGRLSRYDSYRLKRSYSDLWHRLFTEYNKGKSQDERIESPIGILEEYCRLYENHLKLLDRLDSPREFSDKFVSVSFNIELDKLWMYYKRGQDTLIDVQIGVEEKTLNNNDVSQMITNNFYEVPEEWLI